MLLMLEPSHPEQVQLSPSYTSTQSSSHYIIQVITNFLVCLAPGSVHTLFSIESSLYSLA